MSEKFRFDPVRSSEEIILQLPYSNGSLYFATDTGRVYLDCTYQGEQKNKLPVGGGGVSLIYGYDEHPIAASEEEDNVLFSLALEYLDGKARIDDLILNSDGCFYKVLSVTDTIANCLRLAVSGSGGGGGPISSIIDIYLDYDSSTVEQGYTYIYGAKTNAIFTPRSDTDSKVTMVFTITDNITEREEKFTAANLTSGAKYKFDTSKLPLSTDITLKITVSAMNSLMYGQSRTWTFGNINTVQMGIKKANNNFQAVVLASDVSGEKVLEYIPVGDSSRGFNETLHLYIDGEEQILPNAVKTLTRSNFNQVNTINVGRQSHGSHIVELAVSAEVQGVTIFSEPISFDIAWQGINGENTPIVWINDYDTTVINYENSYVHYMVFDPEAYENNLPATVQLYKDGVRLNELQLTYSASGWAEWDISAIYEVGANLFSIACRGAKKDFTVNVTTEGSRDLGLVKSSSLISNFTSAGRSNLELKTVRETWTDSKGNVALLSGFNWQSNGWQKDPIVADKVDNGTYLSLTNGASIVVPCRSITMNDTDDYSIEVRFRVRNVQEYSTLVQVMPTYFYKDSDGVSHDSEGDGKLLSEIEENGWTILRDEWGNMRMDENNTIKKTETTRGVICKWMNGDEDSGFCIGSQEAFFKTKRGTINVRYKEDEVINITFVVSKSDGLVYIYLNGILSGANSLPSGASASFTVNSPFTFVSDYCDIDLYRLRVYQTKLSMPDVIHNYLSDLHSIALYDQNQLTDAMRPTQLSYQMLLDYNRNNPTNVSMPYATWEITSTGRNEKLPYFKGDKCKVNIKFVNTPLDAALDQGLIDEWFYYTHSPSFEAVGVEINVQGTSSQGYPRRNYKTKYKSATPSEDAPNNKWIYTKGSLAGELLTNKHTVLQTMDVNGNLLSEPVEKSLGKKFFMDNEKLSTNKFTWKIDYMESSGTYNTGFANLLGNLQHPLYNKHPLDDLGISGNNYRTTVYGYPVLTFHKYADPRNNPGNSTGSTDEAFIYEYIGRYNMNLDKSSNEYYGYELEQQHPYMEEGIMVKDVAECWELEDNQGTWCSWKYPNAAARAAGFGTAQDDNPDRLEIMRHFEYRYSAYGDELDAIGPDGKYDGVVKDADSESGQAIIARIGTTDREKSAFARGVYSNLERLFNWLDSTDTGAATNNDLDEAKVYRTTIDYNGSNGATSVDNGVGAYNTTFTKDTADYRIEKFRNEFTKHLDKEYCLIYFIMTELLLCYDSRGKNMMMSTWGPHEVGGDYIWYPTFYDIDTQLGLNNSGAYLWDYDADVTADGLFSTPTSVLWTNFYAVFGDDIKNKYRVLRGVNDGTRVSNNLSYENIAGAYECDAEVFKSYAMAGVRPVIAIGLDEYYKYFATTTNVGYFDTKGIKIIETSPQYAYCCQGDKKLTTELLLRNRLNYIDSWWLGGDYEINKAKQGQFWGRVNGNRIDKTSDIYIDLSSEEIARRAALSADYLQVESGTQLNEGINYYIFDNNDYVLATSEQLEAWGTENQIQLYYQNRMSAEQKAAYEKYNRAQAATYPKAYFDSIPGFTFKPFLKEYVSYFTDEVPGTPIKYTGEESQINGIRTHVPEATIATYKTEAESPNEQLVYIPGLDYLSSLGDLSTSYFSEFSLESGKRLLDLILGSDVPGYKNNLIDENKKFELHNGINDTGKKSLLKKVVLTGMLSFDKTLDMQGSGKLQEFRALNTKLPSVYFASGAPLHTVHLPSTINSLELIENSELTRILTSKPVVCTLDGNGVAQYADPATYRGLYIEGITDSNIVANSGHTLSALAIEGGGLKFDSFKILQNLVTLKKNATTNKTLRLGLKEVCWTPYSQVEEGTPYDSTQTYWQATDHSTFIAYQYTNEENWNFDVLNGIVYTYDAILGNSNNRIQNLSVLNDIITLFNSDAQFSGIIAGTKPTITGELYVNNNSSILEDSSNPNTPSLNYYKRFFPNLNIRVRLVSESNITKFVKILDSGKIETVELLRTTDSHPVLTTTIPTKTNYDFKGWATDKEGTQILLEYNAASAQYGDMTAFNEYTFSNNNKTLVLYAVFEYHKHIVDFVYPDGHVISKEVTWNTAVETPDEIPYREDIDASNNPLPTEQTWQFLGWSTHQNADEADPRFVNGTFIVTKDYLASSNSGIYTVWSENPISVYDNIHPEFFEVISTDSTFTDTNGDGLTHRGLTIQLAKAVRGKLTIPSSINGQPVVVYKSSCSGTSSPADQMLINVTHVFFAKESNGTTNIASIADYTFFRSTNLRYFEFANGLKSIGERAFQNVNNLVESTIISGTINTIRSFAFTTAMTVAASENRDLIIDGNVKYLFSNAFANLNNATFNTLQFGTSDNKSSLIEFNTAFSGNAGRFNEIIIYAVDPNNNIFKEENRSQLLMSIFGSGYNIDMPVTILS